MMPRPPISTLFPYTTLFRSRTDLVIDQKQVIDFEQGSRRANPVRSEEHTSELQSHSDLVCRLLLEKKKQDVINGPACSELRWAYCNQKAKYYRSYLTVRDFV